MTIHLPKPTIVLLSLAAILLVAPTVSDVHGAPDSTAANDAFVEGWTRYRQNTPEDFAKAVLHFQRAIQLDPDYGRAHAALALVYAEGWLNEWSVRMGIGWYVSRDEAKRHLKAAMKDPSPLAHRVASLMFTIENQYEQALTEAERAIALDPNDPIGYEAMARILLFVGKPEKSLESIYTAQRLAPQTNFLFGLGRAQFHLERYEDAAATLHTFTQRDAADYLPFLYLTAAYGHLRREDEAKSAFQSLSKIYLSLRSDKAAWKLEQLDETRIFSKQAADLLREGLQTAGIGSTQAQVIEASAKGITLKKTSPQSSLQKLYKLASEHCQSHGKKSSLISSSSPTYVFGCY